MAALREVQVAQFGVLLLVIGDGWDAAGLQAVEHAGVFDANRHRMAGEPLGVGHHEFVGGIAEGVAQGLDLGLSGTAPSRRVGFVGEKHGVGGHRVPVKTPPSFHVGDEAVDDLPHVLDVQPRPVVGGIGRGRTEDLGDGLNTTLFRLGVPFDDKRSGAHAEDQSVATAVKRQGGFLDHVVGGGCTGRREAAGDPFPKVVAGDVVTADDDHAVDAVGVKPVFRYAERCGSGGACEVDGGVWTTNPRVLSELGVPHVEGLEEVASVKATLAIIPVGFGVLDTHLKAGETRGKHDTGAFPLNLRDLPVSDQTQATFANLFHRCKRNTGIPQRQQSGSDRQLGADVPCENGFGIDAEFFGEVKGAFQAGQLRNVAKHLGLVHVDRAVSPFDEPDDVLVQKALLVFVRDFADAGFPSNQFLKRILREHPVHAGQAQRNARDHVRVHVAPRGGAEGAHGVNGRRLQRNGRSDRRHGRPCGGR